MKHKSIIFTCLLLCFQTPSHAVTFEQIPVRQFHTLNRAESFTRNDYLLLYDKLNFHGDSIFLSSNIEFKRENILLDLSKQVDSQTTVSLMSDLPYHKNIEINDLGKLNILRKTFNQTFDTADLIYKYVNGHYNTEPIGDSWLLGSIRISGNAFQRELAQWIKQHKFELHTIKNTRLYFKKDLTWLVYDLQLPNELKLQGLNILSTLGLQLDSLSPADNHVTFSDKQFNYTLEIETIKETLIISQATHQTIFQYDPCNPNILPYSDMVNLTFDAIYDLRNLDAFNNKHLPDAKHVQLSNLISSPDYYFNKQGRYLLYCYQGITSAKAMQYLQSIGYDTIYSLKGGLELDNNY